MPFVRDEAESQSSHHLFRGNVELMSSCRDSLFHVNGLAIGVIAGKKKKNMNTVICMHSKLCVQKSLEGNY